MLSAFWVFGLSWGRSDNEFCAEEGQNPIFDPLPRNEKLCGKICRTSLLYEMSYSFRSTVFVPMEFWNISCPKLIKAVTWVVQCCAPTCATTHYVAMNKTDTIYMLCRRIFSTHAHNTTCRPGLFLSAAAKFLERAEIFNKNFPELAPQKNVSA